MRLETKTHTNIHLNSCTLTLMLDADQTRILLAGLARETQLLGNTHKIQLIKHARKLLAPFTDQMHGGKPYVGLKECKELIESMLTKTGWPKSIGPSPSA